jgi:hypothetical protein
MVPAVLPPQIGLSGAGTINHDGGFAPAGCAALLIFFHWHDPVTAMLANCLTYIDLLMMSAAFSRRRVRTVRLSYRSVTRGGWICAAE